jgi:hypothetical protein
MERIMKEDALQFMTEAATRMFLITNLMPTAVNKNTYIIDLKFVWL